MLDSNDETLLEFVPQNIENYIISRKLQKTKFEAKYGSRLLGISLK